MRKIFFIVPSILILLGCNSGGSDFTIDEEVISLQEEIDDASTETKEALLQKTSDIIQKYPMVHDSLRAEQAYLKGKYFTEKGMLDSASVYFQEATNYIKEGPLSERHLTYFYWAWDTYLDKEAYGECIAINQKFKLLLQENNDDRLTSIAHSLDKTIHLKRKEFQKALSSSNQQIKFLKRTGDTSDVVSALISRTKILDDVYPDRKEVYRVLDSLVVHSDEYSNGINRLLYGQYGVNLFHQKRFAEASDYFKKGLSFAKQLSNPVTRKKRTSNIYNNLAEVSLELKRYNQAQSYLDTVYAMGLGTLESRHQRAFLRYQFRLSANTNKDVGQVLSVLDSLNAYQNESYEAKYTKDLEALTIANENERILQQEKQESDFKNFRLRIILAVGGVVTVLFGLIGMLFYRQKKFGLERENLLTEQRLLRAQMNPHFTFNTLSVIGEMIEKNPKDAKNYLVKFSRLLASIFENSTFTYVLLEKELDSLKEYMDLQRIRFPESFNYTIELNNVESDLLYVPGMLLQPFIENSINHGFQGIDYPGEITIDLKEEGSFIHCEIQDNGKGLNISEENSGRKSSTQLIKTFLEKVTKRPCSIQNKKDIFENETGVIVTFSIPFKETLND